MTIVADTGPLNYLILIGEIELLPRMYGGVLIPWAVVRELQDVAAPDPVRCWASERPAWATVRSVPAPAESSGLHLGELRCSDWRYRLAPIWA